MKNCSNFSALHAYTYVYANTVSFTTLSVVTVIGNLLVILVVIKDPLKKLKTPFNYFLVNLAVCDFMAGAVVMPLMAFSNKIGLPSNVSSYVYFVSVGSVLFSTWALSIDRLIGVTKPMMYRANISVRRCFGI